jgi:hypothetical protein
MASAATAAQRVAGPRPAVGPPRRGDELELVPPRVAAAVVVVTGVVVSIGRAGYRLLSAGTSAGL